MAIDETLVLKGEGNVDVQVGGPGHNWVYLSACASMGGASVPKEGTELRYCQDITRAGKFKISNKIKTAADAPNGDLVTKLGQIDYLDGLECPFGIRARYAKCGAREDVQNYNPIMLVFSGVDLESEDYDDLVISSPDNEDEILVTTPWTATYNYRIKTVEGARMGSAADLGEAWGAQIAQIGELRAVTGRRARASRMRRGTKVARRSLAQTSVLPYQ